MIKPRFEKYFEEVRQEIINSSWIGSYSTAQNRSHGGKNSNMGRKKRDCVKKGFKGGLV